ncbi:hypothetical protein BASA81_005326 [Batrachochytrium salamandrivorans]|nr:hypothetical protein BASA81_005326 [Batrachochytrium salamandrivorans]
MTPAFDEVADLFNDGPSGAQLAFVDCTVQDQLCQKYGVTGYPTLKVFTSEFPEGQAYSGGRDVKALKTYAEENLASVKCTPKDSGANCDEKEKTFLDKFSALGKDAVNKELARLDALKSGSMSPDLKKWLFKRIAILKEL